MKIATKFGKFEKAPNNYEDLSYRQPQSLSEDVMEINSYKSFMVHINMLKSSILELNQYS